MRRQRRGGAFALQARNTRTLNNGQRGIVRDTINNDATAVRHFARQPGGMYLKTINYIYK